MWMWVARSSVAPLTDVHELVQNGHLAFAAGLAALGDFAAGLDALGDFAAGLGLFLGVAFLGAGLLVNASRE